LFRSTTFFDAFPSPVLHRFLHQLQTKIGFGRNTRVVRRNLLQSRSTRD
jgi:hypothetical protein